MGKSFRICVGLFVGLCLASSIALLDSSSAKAWQGADVCSSMPINIVDAMNTVRNQYPTGWIGSLDPEDENLIGVYGLTTNGDLAIYWNGEGAGQPLQSGWKIVFYSDNGENYFKYVKNSSERTSGYGLTVNDDGTYKGDGQSGPSHQSISCIAGVIGDYSFEESWTDNKYKFGGFSWDDIKNDAEPRCDSWDVGCWFSSVIGKTIDGFQALGDLFVGTITGLGEWIANLIMPSNADGSFDNVLSKTFNDILNGFRDRLGFLLFPFEFIGSVQSAIFTHYNPGGAEGGCGGVALSVPNVLGNNSITLNPCMIQDNFPTIWEVSKVFIRIVYVIGVISLAHMKYMQIVKGDET